MLAATFPDLPLPAAPPPLPVPALPIEGVARLAILVVERSHEIGASAADATRADAAKTRAARDRIADPSIGLRGFSEQGGNERGFGLIVSMPFGSRSRAAAADKASASAAVAVAELAATRNAIDAMAAEDAALATGYLAVWEQAERAASTLPTGWSPNGWRGTRRWTRCTPGPWRWKRSLGRGWTATRSGCTPSPRRPDRGACPGRSILKTVLRIK